MIESRRLAADTSFKPLSVGSVCSPSQFSDAVPADRSPRMASPESSSLSSGSPASVFSAVPPSERFPQSNATLPSPAVESAPSMSDLSLWEMPKLDIDLIDQIILPGYRTESDVVPVITQTSATVLRTSEPTLSLKPSQYVGNISLQLDLCDDVTADKSSASTYNGTGASPISDGVSSKSQEIANGSSSSFAFKATELTKLQDQTANGNTVDVSEPTNSTPSGQLTTVLECASKTDEYLPSSNCVSFGPDNVVVAKDVRCPTALPSD